MHKFDIRTMVDRVTTEDVAHAIHTIHDCLFLAGICFIVIQPGDATRYEMVITQYRDTDGRILRLYSFPINSGCYEWGVADSNAVFLAPGVLQSAANLHNPWTACLHAEIINRINGQHEYHSCYDFETHSPDEEMIGHMKKG